MLQTCALRGTPNTAAPNRCQLRSVVGIIELGKPPHTLGWPARVKAPNPRGHPCGQFPGIWEEAGGLGSWQIPSEGAEIRRTTATTRTKPKRKRKKRKKKSFFFSFAIAPLSHLFFFINYLFIMLNHDQDDRSSKDLNIYKNEILDRLYTLY